LDTLYVEAEQLAPNGSPGQHRLPRTSSGGLEPLAGACGGHQLGPGILPFRIVPGPRMAILVRPVGVTGSTGTFPRSDTPPESPPSSTVAATFPDHDTHHHHHRADPLMAEDLDHQVAFSARFRNVSTRYPRRVAEAYGGDTEQAMADNPETVAETVAAWEVEQGKEPTDWAAIGRSEGHDGTDPGPPLDRS
jgi:hypothetical protein